MICEKTKQALQTSLPGRRKPEPEDNQSTTTTRSTRKESQNTCTATKRCARTRLRGSRISSRRPGFTGRSSLQAVTILDEAEFFIESITGVDWIKENQLEVIYDFSRYDFDLCRVVIRHESRSQQPRGSDHNRAFMPEQTGTNGKPMTSLASSLKVTLTSSRSSFLKMQIFIHS